MSVYGKDHDIPVQLVGMMIGHWFKVVRRGAPARSDTQRRYWKLCLLENRRVDHD